MRFSPTDSPEEPFSFEGGQLLMHDATDNTGEEVDKFIVGRILWHHGENRKQNTEHRM